jgi:ParB family chromosome partitioning protein
MATNDSKVERWELDRLRPHPKQGQYFPDAPAHELEELAADMKANGQLQAVEVLADGVILCGHRRVAAARLLGWTEVIVWVRDDLIDDPAAAEMRLVEDNLHRRQLGKLGLARCYQGLKMLECKAVDGRLMGHEQGDLRDRLAQRLGGVSGRSLDRLLRVVEHTPAEVQAAAEAGTLPMTMAERVAGLTAQRQAEIAEELRGGGEPREVVRRFLAAAPCRAKNAIDAKDRLVQALKRGAADLDGRLREVHHFTGRDMEALREGERLIGQLLEQGRAVRAAEAAEGELPPAEEVDVEADEAGGPADTSAPDNVAGGTGCSRTGGCGRVPEYSAARGLPGDRPAPGQAAGRGTTRKSSRSRPAGARKGRTRP